MRSNNTAELVIETVEPSICTGKIYGTTASFSTFLCREMCLVRYKQTTLGIASALIKQPSLTMLVLTLVFRQAGKVALRRVPYPILVFFAATLPWQFFANALSEGSNSLPANTELISKIYLPA